jgi:hypothetical protein
MRSRPALQKFMTPNVRASDAAIYDIGVRKGGMPEESPPWVRGTAPLAIASSFTAPEIAASHTAGTSDERGEERVSRARDLTRLQQRTGQS